MNLHVSFLTKLQSNLIKNCISNMQIDWIQILALVYTVTWSFSFIGQAYSNYKNKNVEGFSLNYVLLNLNGNILYTIYTSVGFFTNIQGAGTVVLADIIYVYYALFMTFVLLAQCFIYPKGNNKILTPVFIFTLVIWSIIFLQGIFTVYLKLLPWNIFWNPISFLGYSKLAFAMMKNFPQFYWNWKRKSTKGWSIFMINADLVGGIFSMLSAIISNDQGWNVTKLLLGTYSIIIDLVYIIQHYCLYTETNTNEANNNQMIIGEQQNLLQDTLRKQSYSNLNQDSRKEHKEI